MRKLLSANFARLRRDKVFWLCAAAILLLSLVSILNGCRQATELMSDYAYTLDDYFFNALPFLGLFTAIFTSMFLGTEHSDGAMRNKLAAGHSRAGIYLSNLTVSFSASLVFLAAWFLGGLAGIPALGPWQMGPGSLVLFLLLAALLSAALSALFTLLATVCTHRAASAVLSILLFLVLLLCASMIYNRLCEPEFYSGVVFTGEGMQMGEPHPNPDYLSGVLRTLYTYLLHFLPTGQSILMSNLEPAYPLFMALASLFITALATLAGLALFRRKDLK